MQAPKKTFDFFASEFETHMKVFLKSSNTFNLTEDLLSKRFLNRCIVPHVCKLSNLFNRLDSSHHFTHYWSKTQNPLHLRLAYFLNFMPCNAYRMAVILAELHRLGFKWPLPKKNFSVLDIGSGPGSSIIGLLCSEIFDPSSSLSFALIEQEKTMLKIALEWIPFFSNVLSQNTTVRGFHRKIEWKNNILPSTAPRFHLWLMSYVLNEVYTEQTNEKQLAKLLLNAWKKHVEPEGIIIILEPALKEQSRKLLTLRQQLLAEPDFKEFQILTPCLGHQQCGALLNPKDFCHETVCFMRPAYLKTLDQMTGLDHKSLSFSYLVICRSQQKRENLLPLLPSHDCARLVSPAHKEGPDWEFFLCTPDGKRRTRLHQKIAPSLERGNIILEPTLRGEKNATRLEKFTKII